MRVKNDIQPIDDEYTQNKDTLRGYAGKAINQFLTVRNWLIGFCIVEFEQHGEDRAQYGEKLLETIANS